MSNVYVLMKKNVDYQVINDQHDIIGGPPEEICDIFSTQEAAQQAKEIAEQEAIAEAEEFGCDVDEYFIQEYQVK